MTVNPVQKLVDSMFFSFMDKLRHYANNVIIGNTVLLVDAIIAEDHIVLFSHLNDSMQNIT